MIDLNKSGFSSLAIFNKNGTECFLTMSRNNSFDSGRRISKERPKSSFDPIIDVFTCTKFSKYPCILLDIRNKIGSVM